MTLFAESRAFTVANHAHPVWKMVLPRRGSVRIARSGRPPAAAPGWLIPPQLPHWCAADSAYVALFLDPWLIPQPPEPQRLERITVQRLLAALGTTFDLPAARDECRSLFGDAPAADPRAVHAAGAALASRPLPAIAAEVGLSASRLRALVQQEVGVPLIRLRQWGMLRAAVGALRPGGAGTAAAVAGFADQPHLTRTSRGMLGRTPASLA